MNRTWAIIAFAFCLWRVHFSAYIECTLDVAKTSRTSSERLTYVQFTSSSLGVSYVNPLLQNQNIWLFDSHLTFFSLRMSGCCHAVIWINSCTLSTIILSSSQNNTAWDMSECRVFYAPYLSVFGLEKLRIRTRFKQWQHLWFEIFCFQFFRSVFRYCWSIRRRSHN